MERTLQTQDLSFLVTLSASASLSAAARDLGVSKAAVSKRLAQLEQRLAVVLVNRSTRRMSLTPEGEAAAERARGILHDIDELGQWLDSSRHEPKGLLRVNATLGFGRSHVAPLISSFSRQYPQVEVQLQLSVNPPPLTDDAFDVCIRFGEPPDARVIARRLAANRRLLCAAPAYLKRAGKSAKTQLGHSSEEMAETHYYDSRIVGVESALDYLPPLDLGGGPGKPR